CETFTDCNANGVPDECEADCDADGVPDDCEVDCNANGTPDDCESLTDCNANGVPDECETFTDCDGNGIPDECDPDCDGDGLPDDCETDCNSNGTPDDCETFSDCDGNGVPDECDPDSNGNGVPDACELGTNYCGPAVPNSSGVPALISALGSDVAADNDFSLLATQLPTHRSGYFLSSKTQGFVATPPGSQGNLCLGGQIGRFAKQVQDSGPDGRIALVLDLTDLPPGHQVVQAGETWNFQCWFRDQNPGQTSNFTNGVAVQFQ
ncbi:MAG: hypothetical protein V3T22_00250, partial [Planctomycetota bacterium]